MLDVRSPSCGMGGHLAGAAEDQAKGPPEQQASWVSILGQYFEFERTR